MKLSKICEEIEYTLLHGSMDAEVRDIVYDSRKIAPETMFVCMVGAVTDGHKYIPDAIDKGASVIVLEREEEAGQIPENIKNPDPEEYIPLLEETHCIKRWDAAPELPGAMQFGKYITAKGVLASVGHTQAEFEDIQTAYEAGYTHATHFYNAMPGFHKRKE